VTALRPGYTLLELVLVLALLVIVGAMVYPSLDAMYGDYKLTAATDMVRAHWAEARARAVEEGQPYRFGVVLNQGNYRIAPDSGAYWSGGEPPAPDDPALRPLVVEDALPKGVRFATPDIIQNNPASLPGDSALPAGSVDPGSWTKLVTFLPDGTSLEDVEIVFQARGGRPLSLRLRALTGVVTVRPLTGR
jgi:prepilin-type N-terminal cleavage/methylation domain-containing protein